MSVILSALVVITSFLVVITVLVFFHELGHYSVARLFNVSVERFSIGFGKPIWKRTAKSGTEWVISRIPLGGYVKFLGDAGAASNPDMEALQEIKAEVSEKYGESAVENCFHFKPLWQRALIVVAGPVANFILAIVFFGIVLSVHGEYVNKSEVSSITPGSPAEAAGLQVGDFIKTANGKDVRNFSKLKAMIILHSDENLKLEIERDGRELELSVVPERVLQEDALGGALEGGQIGAGFDLRNYTYITYSPAAAVSRGVGMTGETVALTGTYLKRIFAGKENGKALGGPVRIAAMTGKVSLDTIKEEVPLSQKLKDLFWRLFYFSAALSIGLGIANLMPIPALDGGHLLFYGYEAFAGQPLSEAKQEYGFRIGFAMLLMGLVFLTINDIGYVRSLVS